MSAEGHYERASAMKRDHSTRDSRCPSAISGFARIHLANLPTPLHDLPRLAELLNGPRILIKRDDLTGLATGGNKTRKLEFLMADATAHNADCVITAGGAQSNHCRQTAAAAAACGLACHLVLGGQPPPVPAGNLFLDQLLGAEIHWTDKTRRNERIEELADQLRADGHSPYVIPVGGSNAMGAVGYVVAMFELADQLAAQGETVDRIFVATSSGGTQAGMVLGAAMTGFRGRVVGISIDQHPADQFDQHVATVANHAAELLNVSEHVSAADVELQYDYLGDGYGVVGDLERDAISTLARTEGILAGPVYTGRALGAMMDLVRRGAIGSDETVLFWHTGDESALHAYVGEW
jgi:D-cysteine desulfhydrase